MSEIVTICGSMRFYKDMLTVAATETMLGVIVLMPFCVPEENHDGTAFKTMLDELHKEKINLCHKRIIVVTDQNGYVGISTKNEMVYAANRGLVWDIREFHHE